MRVTVQSSVKVEVQGKTQKGARPHRSLRQEHSQIGPPSVEKVAAPGEQAADTLGILRHLVASHGARAFFDPPANGPLARVVGSIQFLPFGALPAPIAGEAVPEVPAIQIQQAEAIRQPLMLSF